MKNSITLASAVWENDFRIILGTNYFDKLFCINNGVFCNRLLIVNNIKDKMLFNKLLGNPKVKENIDLVCDAETYQDDILKFWYKTKAIDVFNRKNNFKELLRRIIKKHNIKLNFNGFWYSIGPLAALYFCKTDWLCYFTGDAVINNDDDLSWLSYAIDEMEKNQNILSANCVWNKKIKR